MTSNLAAVMAGSYHPAGIYADMSVDGPEIGDLVVVIDKAKNLPNRKTMGKQDPYCAARLGKNQAKKTETDKRGGQTPRWDQELRFTVHDSPDYNRLKISVFNDDKKTDLIGESWISLDKVVVRGGGRSDAWHTLNCKGRFAGEIRIELTYYDIRPKEDQQVDPRRDMPRTATENDRREAVGGPRQLMPASRRPLPSDPTSTSQSQWVGDHQSAAYAQMHDPHNGHGTALSSEELDYPVQHHRPVQLQRHTEPLTAHGLPINPGSRDSYGVGAPTQLQTHVPDHYAASDRVRGLELPLNAGPAVNDGYPSHSYPTDNYDYPISTDDHQARLTQTLRLGNDPFVAGRGAAPLPPTHDSRHTNPLYAPPLNHTQTAPASTASLRALDNERDMIQNGHMERGYHGYDHRSSHESFNESSAQTRQSYDPSSSRGWTDAQYTGNSAAPPPPLHRNSVVGAPIANEYDQAQFPPPLNISSHRNSTSQEAFNRYQNGDDFVSPVPSTTTHAYSPNISPRGSNASQYEPRRHSGDAMTTGRPRGAPADIPQALVPGYKAGVVNPSLDNIRSQGLGHERRNTVDQTMYASSHGASHNVPNVSSQSRSHQDLVGAAYTAPSSTARSHRASAPVINPRAVSPKPRAAARKSVSPRPMVTPAENQLRGVPFSPDSYDALNPNVGSSPITAASRTPERRREPSNPDGSPIVRSDGRVVDPSDHLPTDTWAPEPERKGSNTAAALPASRPRPSPQGAQAMSHSARRPAREAAARPLSMGTPIYGHSPEPRTPDSAARVRLHKKVRPQSSSPALVSSPLSPYASNNGTPRSLPRASPAEHPLREHENYGHGSNPSYSPYGNGARSSPLAPALPAKVPYNGGGRDDLSALSEELRTIDIGSGRRATRRSYY
ncbi:MAG: hypothetical protein M1825_004001 [Sarcosagium campestre]|nr:MAG: hypothetical protein M1825_004001 [Sarcosagium campestre]